MKQDMSNVITVLLGKGEFLDFETNEIYEIHSINIPFLANGKNIAVVSKDDPEVLEWREYEDGKIISFKGGEIEHWD
jgi:hypothetical protein